MIEAGNIVKNLAASEAVVIDSIKKLGAKYSLHYTGVNSNRKATKILDSKQIEALEVIASDGEFNFRGDPEKFILFAEAERINSAYQFDPLFAINCSVVDTLPHQVEAVYKFMLPQPRIRFLLADDTGAGKTIMTGLLVKELLMRRIVERILIVTPGGLTKQWQTDEMGVKFNIPFKLVDRSIFSKEPAVFQTSRRIISSIDFISREDVLETLKKTTWDLVVFDEAHKLSAYEYGEKIYKSNRYKAAEELSKLCDHLLLLTATPHRGRRDTFKRLMKLLDEDIFATADLTSERVRSRGDNKYFIRRLKEDMKDWDGNPLYKKRFTKTVSYQLTDDEKRLYDNVTKYLTIRKKEADQTKNIHVTLALQVMQRRLVSSIFAVRNTLQRRWKALQELADELERNPALWKQKVKTDDMTISNLDDFDDLDDEERDALEGIMSDPKKLKLFTTSKNPAEIKEEAAQVKALFSQADALYSRRTEEQKYIELKRLLTSEGVVDGEKLVIFTEHKDTLFYLQERLTNTGYSTAAIHGGMSVDERTEAQCRFMSPEVQILICTDAAGEGINLQFCRLLINWDIPWNPNRLEQRMGRIHRYGQKSDVLVFNMVAGNTREGQVLRVLLHKLDVIREQLGDDRVYDVIQDVMGGIPLDKIMSSVLGGQENELNALLARSDSELGEMFKASIDNQMKALEHSPVDYRDAQLLKDDSDERRLQPIYIRQFFERAFLFMGGKLRQEGDDIYRITEIPERLARRLNAERHINASSLRNMLFFFDKRKYLDYRMTNPQYGRAHYINPGNPLFDCLLDEVRDSFRNDMLKGTVLVSPEDKLPYFGFLVKNKILDNRSGLNDEQSAANELLTLICQQEGGDFVQTSPAKLLDLCPPKEFAKQVTPPEPARQDEVMEWAYENLTEPLLEETEAKVKRDTERRLEYLKEAFRQIIMDMQEELNDLQGKMLFSDDERLQQKVQQKEEGLQLMKVRKRERLEQLEQETELSPAEPQVLGCAYMVPLSQMEYSRSYGMSRDDGVEAVAMEAAMSYESSQGRRPFDVSKEDLGYDIRSEAPDGSKRYIEVKGRSRTDGVMLSENEMNRLEQLGKKAWLYIVSDCALTPKLNAINDPAATMRFEKKSKGVQYFLPLDEWQGKVNE